jgi:hypothetical protein
VFPPDKFGFTGAGADRTLNLYSHGQPEKETSSEDEQAQAPKALEGKSA